MNDERSDRFDGSDRSDRFDGSDRPDRSNASERPTPARSTIAADASPSGLTRRRLLASGVAAGTLATAGCLGTRDGEVPEPVVTDDSIDEDWRLVEASDSVAFEESYGPLTVSALERTVVYEYVDIAEAVADAFDADGSPVTFFAARIDIRPAIDSLPGGIGRDRLMNEVRSAAEAAFRDQLREAGVTDIERVDDGEATVAGGHTASTATFVAAFGRDWEVPLPDGSTAVADGVAEMTARLAVWHDGTDVLISGGAHPTEPLSDTIERALDVPLGAETVVDELIDDTQALATEPETFEEAVEALIPSVE